MRLWIQRVPEKQQQVHLVAGDARGDLLVAALGTAQKALDLQTGSLRYHFARRSRGAQEVAAEHAAIGNTKLDHQFFFGVVGDECDVHVYHSFQ